MAPDSSQPQPASHDIPKVEFEIPTPASRGLCDECARYNWRFHLTRELDNQPKDALYCHEEALVKDASQRKWTGGVVVSSTPYGGSYSVKDEYIYWNWPRRRAVENTAVDCSVCHLVATTAREEGIVLPRTCRIGCYSEFGEGSDPSILTFYVSDRKTNSLLAHRSMTLPEWSKARRPGRIQPGPRIPPGPRQINLSLLSRWTSTCRSQHRTCWSKPRLRPESIPFRLIDVTLDRVVPAPALCEYLALSYVWGDISPYTLTRSEVDYRHPHDRSFDNSFTLLDRNTLPQTIRDAMFVVACIGERYLWVDSLCIVQDDIEDLSQNLRQMHRIYSGACLTIVAAGGDNADAGLSGLYPGSRDLRLFETTIDTVDLVQTEPEFPSDETAWHHRGWTYQEYHFSDRCMIFANDRVYFECSSGQLSEHMPDYPRKDSLKVSHQTKKASAVETYEGHVMAYTQRHLTFEADILKAFTAIMNEHEERHGTKFCWGLPQNNFIRGLLWERRISISSKKLRRREPQPDGTCFPSWSWAGWVGAVIYDHDLQYRSPIVWPWERKYDIDAAYDYMESGVLTVRGKLVTINPESSNYHHVIDKVVLDEDNVSYQPVQLTGLLLGYGLASDHINDEDAVERTVAVLMVEQQNNGVYARKGLLNMQKPHLEDLEVVEQIIHLG